MSSNNTERPSKEDGESNASFFARLQEYQTALNANHTQEAQTEPTKFCGECSHENNTASKTCGGCGQRLN